MAISTLRRNRLLFDNGGLVTAAAVYARDDITQDCLLFTYSLVQVDGVLARHDIGDGGTTALLSLGGGRHCCDCAG